MLLRKLALFILNLTLITILTACGTSPQVMAEQRLFLDLSLEFLGEYQLPQFTFEDTLVGGLSAITYDRTNNLFYVLSDDPSKFSPARFYTLSLQLTQNDTQKAKIDKVEIKNVTFLLNEKGETFPKNTIDSEGISLSPKQTVFISSEGSLNKGISPFIREFDLETGQQQQELRLPLRYLPNDSSELETSPQGIQNNLGFESLSLNANGLSKDDPFRLFTATESSLLQDSDSENSRIRLMHYLINPIGEPILIAEHLYLLDNPANETINQGLTELATLEKEGYFLSLERTFGFFGFGAKIFQVTNANATDTSNIASLKGNLNQIEPLKKKLLLDLNDLDIDLDNLEGMTFGPRLSDGSQSLILVSDDNFRDEQVTQFLLFRLAVGQV